ncbi:Translation initiation factor IF-2 [Candidatus Fokinia solitaria]|uniref:Translation initiation factor IF-2 n=1 Tax=Candidatus Fokinia solitaria TaxID=1802984 RepID=A0A2U8BS96_9RICK|nr:translation initiation factor IF-2 [Candidatus Fokinia solitaria]AWD33212.1 Translation initiation factor IF-2 [Candidatus Fokinia solitaria]
MSEDKKEVSTRKILGLGKLKVNAFEIARKIIEEDTSDAHVQEPVVEQLPHVEHAEESSNIPYHERLKAANEAALSSTSEVTSHKVRKIGKISSNTIAEKVVKSDEIEKALEADLDTNTTLESSATDSKALAKQQVRHRPRLDYSAPFTISEDSIKKVSLATILKGEKKIKNLNKKPQQEATPAVAAPQQQQPVAQKLHKESLKSKVNKHKTFNEAEERKRNVKRVHDNFKIHKINTSQAAKLQIDEMTDWSDIVSSKKFRKDRVKKHKTSAPKIIREIQIGTSITISELASRMSEKAADLMKKLISLGEKKTINDTIDYELAALLIEEFGHKHTKISTSASILNDYLASHSSGNKKVRPPIVTVMGHIDHGKTTLLDTLRSSAVAKKEHGGITQHVAAYQVTVKNGQKITFLDTPGHEAFTMMRARGASLTDIVVIVIAADEGVKQQTVEAIRHAKASNVHIIVAANKMDSPNADVTLVKNGLLQENVIPEEMGGDVPIIPISAKTGQGLDILLDTILAYGDMLDVHEIDGHVTSGTVLEAKVTKSMGTIINAIVLNGVLKVGDYLNIGQKHGKIRLMYNDIGESITAATASTPVSIVGLNDSSSVGEKFYVVPEKLAKEIANLAQKSVVDDTVVHRATFDTLAKNKEYRIILKADVKGSLEAIQHAISGIQTDEVDIRIMHLGVGAATESDVSLSSTCNACIICFNTTQCSSEVKGMAKTLGIEISTYNTIYQVLDFIKEQVSGMMKPLVTEKDIGEAEIRQMFSAKSINIAGCRVLSGVIKSSSKVRITRNGNIIHKGAIKSLRKGTEHAKEVLNGVECGICLENYNDIAVGDVIHAYEEIVEYRKL